MEDGAMTGRFRGIFTPLVTPLFSDETIDLASLARLVEWQIEKGVHGLWAMGTTAEFASFDVMERARAAATMVEAARGRVPVIVNASDASTRMALRDAREALAMGADGIAVTPPYYFPHSQDEVLAQYRTIRQAVDLPLFIYNIPQTVRVRVELGTAMTLVADGTVAGIKDSQNDLEWFRQLVVFARREKKEFAAFAGTRHLIDAAVLAGADGAIPSVANAFPALCVGVFEAADSGDFGTASRLQTTIVDVESASTSLRGGSRNAQVLGVLKSLLVEYGVIGGATLSGPLRGVDSETWPAVRARIDAVMAREPVA
jgi:4-hydroxy-tetrahydrodipicolinate synthase